MKLFFYFLVLFQLWTIDTYCQNIKAVKKRLVTGLKPKVSEHLWTMKEYNNRIELRYIDTFFINTYMNPLNNRNGIYYKLDTVFIKIRFENDWTEDKYYSIADAQKIILDSLSKKFISYYDSSKWIGVNLNKEMFLERRYTYLLLWEGLTQAEKYQLKKFVRLPDNIIGTVGLFTESNYVYTYLEMQPESVNMKIEAAYQSFKVVLGSAALWRCEDFYW